MPQFKSIVSSYTIVLPGSAHSQIPFGNGRQDFKPRAVVFHKTIYNTFTYAIPPLGSGIVGKRSVAVYIICQSRSAISAVVNFITATAHLWHYGKHQRKGQPAQHKV